MTYNELIQAHPYIDIFMEFFKGIAPTLVALLAIMINNYKAKKREEKGRKENLLYNVKKEMLDKFTALSIMQWQCGADLIKFLSEENKDRDIAYGKYVNSLHNSLYKAQEIRDYYFTMFKALKIDIDCSIVLEESKKYTDKLNDLCEEYYDAYKISCPKERNTQLDIMSEKLSKETYRTKEWTNKIMTEIAESFAN